MGVNTIMKFDAKTWFVGACLMLAAHGLTAAGERSWTVPGEVRTTWIGNSFGGGPKWVQNFIEDMHVAPDGTVYAASFWDEAGREFGIYRGGDVVGMCPDTHGWGEHGGYAVAAGEQYLFLAKSHGNEGGHLTGEKYPPKGFDWYGVSRRRLDGSHAPFEGGRGRFGDMLVLHESETHAQARGLAVGGGRLYVSDAAAGEIKAFDTETMALVTSWRVRRPRQIALDAEGGLWVLRAAEGTGGRPSAARYSPDGGSPQKEIDFPGDANPTAICVNRKTGELFVADGGPSQQVLVYAGLDGRPRLRGRFGREGGVFSGPKPGLVGPDRFCGPTGVGTDSAGNVYVGCNTPGGGTVLRAFAPGGRMLWQLLGLEFVDTADVDPADGTDGAHVYTTEGHYVLDWAKPPGQQWTWRALSVDPFRYPDDMRLHEGRHNFCAPLVRRIRRHRFLVVRGMFHRALAIYRYDDEIAVPSVVFSRTFYPSGWKEGDWRPPHQPAKGRWMWRDTDGDGQMAPDEYFDADGRDDPEFWAWWMDARGDIWQGFQTGPEPIRHWPLEGLDAEGNPVYSLASCRAFPMPAPMNHLLRIEYHPSTSCTTDTMFLAGHTADRPKTGGEWGIVGSEILRLDDWRRGGREVRWRIALPYDPAQNVLVKSFCTEGDVVFAVELSTAKIHVYDARTGAKLGEMTPGPEVHRESGWVDFPDAVRAYRRRSGEYLVFVEEDWKGKVIVYRWTPAGM